MPALYLAFGHSGARVREAREEHVDVAAVAPVKQY
jgi:hypothetical protein